MKLTLGTNIASLMAQRQLAKGQDTLSTVFERLSSGQRINRASDDAAGLAIADTLRADARVHTAAIRNINDGLSLLNIMDSALEAQAGILTRLQELAEQAANGVYSTEQGDALNTEYQALVTEFGRIGDSTEFNDRKLLNGNDDSINIQVGTSSDINSLLSFSTQNSGDYSGVIDISNQITTSVLNRFTNSDTTTLEGIFDFHQNKVQLITVTDANGDERTLAVGLIRTRVGATDDGMHLVAYEQLDDGSFDNTQAASDIVAILTVGEPQVAFETDPDTGLLIANGSISTSYNLSGGGTADVVVDLSNFRFVENGVKIDQFQVLSSSDITQTTAITFTGVETSTRALFALETVSNRLDEVSSIRGEIGANMSRLEFALRVAENTRDSYLAAESRIRDADVAEEVAKLTQAQILQQVGAAVLAQANQQPQITLGLLTGIKEK